MNTIRIVLLALFVSSGSYSRAEPPEVSQTNGNSLNDLLRDVPFFLTSWEDQTRRLSAIQEQLYLHERRMRGEGLPDDLASLFSENYSMILSALVEERISDECGRDLLSLHRQLVGYAVDRHGDLHRFEGRPRNPGTAAALLRAEIERQSVPLAEVPHELRTPVVNGYQVWVGELIAWGEACGKLTPGDLSRLRSRLSDLERFERYYKQDGTLRTSERELLHGRFVKLARETIQTLSR